MGEEMGEEKMGKNGGGGKKRWGKMREGAKDESSALQLFSRERLKSVQKDKGIAKILQFNPTPFDCC